MVKHRILDQQKVLAEACAMASEDGIEGLNFQALAKRLDIRSQSLYNYYPNIEAVIEALGAQFMTGLYDRLVAGLTGIAGVDALRQFAQIAHDYFDSTGNLVQLIYYVHRYADASPFVQALSRVIALLKQLVAGVQLKTMTPDAFVQGLISSVLGFTVLEIMGLLPAGGRHEHYQQMLALYLNDVRKD